MQMNFWRNGARRAVLALSAVVTIMSLPVTAGAQTQRDEQFYYPGGFNWRFVKNYPAGARLFNAFDYGHSVLYEKLYTETGATQAAALEKEYLYLTTDLLIRPPRFAIVEEAVMPGYAKFAWRAKQMFDWAHILHRQIYDIYSDHRLSPARKDSLIEEVTDYYLGREEYAFLAVPKSMALMDDQYYSQAFREAYPKFNGLIWAYHWLQVGLYEPYIDAMNRPPEQIPSETKSGVQATLARFWSMLEDAPNRFPKVMPMTSAIAPQFSAAHPRAAVIFDNLHMMHDIISDILQNDAVPENRKGEAIDQALDEFQDPTKNVMTMEMWRNMASHMGGVAAMGGPATGILREVETTGTPPKGGLDHGAHDAPAPAAAAPNDSTADSVAVAVIVERFHRQLTAGDSAGVLALLASDAIILESGSLETREEYRAHHLPADIAFASAVPAVRTPVSMTISGDAAWVASTSTARGQMRGRDVNSAGTELMVLVRREGQWRIAAIHWSSRTLRNN